MMSQYCSFYCYCTFVWFICIQTNHKDFQVWSILSSIQRLRLRITIRNLTFTGSFIRWPSVEPHVLYFIIFNWKYTKNTEKRKKWIVICSISFSRAAFWTMKVVISVMVLSKCCIIRFLFKLNVSFLIKIFLVLSLNIKADNKTCNNNKL